MKEILIFAGTTEGRTLSERLCAAGLPHQVCVATEYGEILMKEHPAVRIHRGRMDEAAMRKLMEQGSFGAVVDATHPYAQVVTEHIKKAMEGLSIPYLRLLRDTEEEENEEGIRHFPDHRSCARALKEICGNILLTTGSKDLAVYCEDGEVKERLYVRVLPGPESLGCCMEQGIRGKQILALQGPFTREMNEAIIGQYQIRCLVTKNSGKIGGYPEKVEAARKARIPVFVIGGERDMEGQSFSQVCEKLESIFGKTIPAAPAFDILLVGIGMGNDGTLTRDAYQAIHQADLLLGAERMIEAYEPGIEKRPYYQANQIIPYLKKLQKGEPMGNRRKVVILFSGDSGFYSGCQEVYRALKREIEDGKLNAAVHILPGISSVAYLAASTGESYQDACIGSLHGKQQYHLVKKIREEKKTFLLTSGVSDMNRLGLLLKKAGLMDCRIRAGYQLSYPEEEILSLSPEECCSLKKEGLYTCLIQNPHPVRKTLTHGKPDSFFLRDRVPMTKEEVREVSICKLRLHEGAVVYDIGSGTGSIAVEVGTLSSQIQVIAIERKAEAVSLIRKNLEAAELDNVRIIEGEAPDVFSQLPAPTHAFIGGSGGRLKEILTALSEKTPEIRVVINAITLETLCEIREALERFPAEQEEILMLQAARGKKVGGYHLMQAENPVWICSFTFGRAVNHEA